MVDMLKFNYKKGGVKEISPVHPFVQNYVFPDGEDSEALLAHFTAEIAEKNGLDANDMQHIFPLILRMLKSKSEWAN